MQLKDFAGAWVVPEWSLVCTCVKATLYRYVDVHKCIYIYILRNKYDDMCIYISIYLLYFTSIAVVRISVC